MKIDFKKKFSKFIKAERKANTDLDNLSEGQMNLQYIITDIKSNNEEMDNFLFSLGCYKGEEIIIISKIGDVFVINIKDARYSIDENLAKAIKIEVA